MMTTTEVRDALFDAIWEKLEGFQDWEVLEGRAGASACVEIDGTFFFTKTEFFDEVPEGEKIDSFLEDLRQKTPAFFSGKPITTENLLSRGKNLTAFFCVRVFPNLF